MVGIKIIIAWLAFLLSYRPVVIRLLPKVGTEVGNTAEHASRGFVMLQEEADGLRRPNHKDRTQSEMQKIETH